MSKALVERYEQILSRDPASTVFVELAKALIGQGEHGRAIDVCKNGLRHHTTSVVGRVLWGKALINLGRPAEAMEQFDLAIGIDKDNPHAYNLIGEVLLHKGLYRSALPLLRKAVVLQPNDARVKQWLEQTQRALAGGPAPVLTEATDVSPLPDTDTDPAAATAAADDATELNLTVEAPQGGDDSEEMRTELNATVPEGAGEPETVPGMTDTFRALDQRPEEELEAPATEMFTPLKNGAARRKPTDSSSDAAGEEIRSEPTIVPSPELYRDAPEDPVVTGGLLDEVPSVQSEVPSHELEVPPPPSRPRAAARAEPPVAPGLGSLLADVPDLAESGHFSTVERPRSEVSSHRTEAIAREYERELREKLAASAARKTFLQRHGGKVAVTAVLSAAALAFGGFFAYTTFKNRGRTFTESVAEAKRLIAQDTRASYRAALEALDLAIGMDSDRSEAWALLAYAHALLFAEHGGDAADRTAALTALSKPRVRQDFPALVLVSDYYLADDAAQEDARKALISSSSATALDEVEVHELMALLYLRQKKNEDALLQLQRAVTQAAERRRPSVRALVLLADYYRENGDFENALRFYGEAAEQISPKHPARVVGAGEVRLGLERELDKSLAEVEALVGPDAPEAPMLPRYALVLGQLLSAAGRHAEALKVLTDGLEAHKGRAFDFQMALGDASRAAGKMDLAQKAFEAALKQQPKNEDAREALGRTLIARDREKDALRVLADADGRKVALVRGIAAARLGDWRRARADLARTEVKGKVPPEAAVYLALADAADGHADVAIEALEKMLVATKKARGYVRVALGSLYWQRGALDKAKAQFEEASKDPHDYEGSCSLGRLVASLGIADASIEPLAKAVSRNSSHAEARKALIQGYLQLGRFEKALAQAEEWQLDSPTVAAAHRAHALASLYSGNAKQAEASSALAVRLEPGNPEGQRVRAQALFAVGNGKNAFSALELANKLDSSSPDTFCEIGLAFMRMGNAPMALKGFEAAKRQDAKNPCGTIGIHYARLPSAVRAAPKELSDLAKNAPRAWERVFAQAILARVQVAQGATKDARKTAEDAVAAQPGAGLAHLSAGLAAQRAKDEVRAKEALMRAVELEPFLGAARLALADLLARSQDPNELARAVSEYDAFLKIGGSQGDVHRVERRLPDLKKRLESR